MTKPDTPFPKHWRYYIFIKWAVIAAALLLALKLLIEVFSTLQNSPVGFASLKGPDHIEMLYVHPSLAGQGVGAMLCDALEKLAGARGAKNLTVDASDTALDFFKKRGYVVKQRNTVTVNGEWLANTTMQKALAEAAPGAPQ